MKFLVLSLLFVGAVAHAQANYNIPIYEAANSLPDHLYSLNSSEGAQRGFPEFLGVAYVILLQPDYYATPLYRCVITATGRHMVSTSPNCEGQYPDNVGYNNILGYIYTEPVAGTVALYRYHQGGFDHIASTNPQAPYGYQLDGILGYVPY